MEFYGDFGVGTGVEQGLLEVELFWLLHCFGKRWDLCKRWVISLLLQLLLKFPIPIFQMYISRLLMLILIFTFVLERRKSQDFSFGLGLELSFDHLFFCIVVIIQ